MKFNKNIKGLVLAEALVSVAVLSLAVLVLSSIFNNAATSMRVSRNYMIAQNLAVEGVEVVKSIRDSNAMIAPNNPECWLVLDPGELVGEVAVGEPDCDGVIATAGQGNYLIVEEGGRWVLNNAGTSLNLEGVEEGNAGYLLHAGDDGRLVYEESALSQPTGFYRSVEFANVSEETASFEVKVQWMEGTRVRTFSTSLVLHNHLFYNEEE